MRAVGETKHRLRFRAPSLKVPDFSDYESITRQELYRAELAAIGRWVTGAVLDVGSNVGRFSAFCPSAVSLDIERTYLLRGIHLGNISRAVVASAHALPFGSERFDTVLAIGLAEHIPSRQMGVVLDELTRVAKADGRLVVRTTSPYAPFALLRLGLWSDSIHPYSPFRLRRELLGRGWRPLAWMSSGLAGLTTVLPQTVPAPVLWARGAIQVFARRRPRLARASARVRESSGGF
jgi:SAM-dependent methyltransferase